MIVLGIETSCDETAAAVVENGTNILSSVVASQTEVHHRYGGVVPELASRKHIESIMPVINASLDVCGMSLSHMDAIAVTRGPGLVGALLVGFSFAKACGYALGIPWIGVNHLAGHLYSVFLADDPPPFPYMALLASGGHTAIYHVISHTRHEMLGQTRDDAAGEAFDKVAKILDLGYPGGSVIDALAKKGDSKKIAFPRAYIGKSSFDFSFSGIKTAVNRYVMAHKRCLHDQIADIAAGFQEAVVEVLSYKLIRAARQYHCRHIALVGGVASNSRLRETARKEADSKGLSVHIPSAHLCGDNAAMIAAVGYQYLKAGIHSGIRDDVFSRSSL